MKNRLYSVAVKWYQAEEEETHGVQEMIGLLVLCSVPHCVSQVGFLMRRAVCLSALVTMAESQLASRSTNRNSPLRVLLLQVYRVGGP